MAFGQVDPARLEGEALRRWYARSPDEIDDERKRAAATRYDSFFSPTRRERPDRADHDERVTRLRWGGADRHPTIFRSNYLSALKAHSNVNNPTTLVRTLDFAQRWVFALPWGDLNQTRSVLDRSNAFMDPVEADDRGIRLTLLDAYPA